jgi:hypothetical protein
MDLNRKSLYRMPWSLVDNPLGWLEVTDICNIKCRGCYRSRIGGHRPLDELKEEIRHFKEERNCDNISIAGGEPTTHPQIHEILRYIKELGMKAVLVTNGTLLNDESLPRLRDSGVTHLGLHVDSFQTRPGWEGADEERLMELRQYFGDLAKRVGGVCCTIGMTVFQENLPILPRIIRWAADNIDRVSGLVFICYRAVPITGEYDYLVKGRAVKPTELSYIDENPQNLGVTSTRVAEAIHEADPDYQPGAYLNGTFDHRSYKWLISTRVGRPGRIFGYLGARTMEISQSGHHLMKGRYMAFVGTARRSPSFVGIGLVDPVFRKSIPRLFADGFRHPADSASPVFTQSLGIVQAPDLVEGAGANMCDSCPDMTWYQGRLVNSCRLDELRKWGGYMTMTRKDG